MNEGLWIPAPLWGVIGVVVGWLLGEGSRLLHARLRIQKLKRMLREELKSILAQLPQKRDILHKLREALGNNRILSGMGVSTIVTAYSYALPELYEHLSGSGLNLGVN